MNKVVIGKVLFTAVIIGFNCINIFCKAKKINDEINRASLVNKYGQTFVNQMDAAINRLEQRKRHTTIEGEYDEQFANEVRAIYAQSQLAGYSR